MHLSIGFCLQQAQTFTRSLIRRRGIFCCGIRTEVKQLSVKSDPCLPYTTFCIPAYTAIARLVIAEDMTITSVCRFVHNAQVGLAVIKATSDADVINFHSHRRMHDFVVHKDGFPFALNPGRGAHGIPLMSLASPSVRTTPLPLELRQAKVVFGIDKGELALGKRNLHSIRHGARYLLSTVASRKGGPLARAALLLFSLHFTTSGHSSPHNSGHSSNPLPAGASLTLRTPSPY